MTIATIGVLVTFVLTTGTRLYKTESFYNKAIICADQDSLEIP